MVAHQITQRVGIPMAAPQHGLLPPGAGVARRFGTPPAGLAPRRPEQPVEESRGGGRHAGMAEQGLEPRLDRAQLGRPDASVYVRSSAEDRGSSSWWKGSDGTAEAQL